MTRRCPKTTILLLLPGLLFPSEYHVDAKAGMETGPGTEAQPFRTITAASAKLKPGDVCIIHAGTYRETLAPVASGAEGNPIVYIAAKGDRVAVSALDPVNGWRLDQDGVYQAPAPKGAHAEVLLAAGARQIEARWPKTTADSFMDGPRAKVREVAASGGQKKGMDIIIDPDIPDFTEDGLKGARIWYLQWYNGWWASADKVARFDPAKKAITLSKDIQSSERARHPSFPFTYVLLGKRQLLTADREWVYEAASNQLYYRPPGGRIPDHDEVEIGVRSTVVDLKGRHDLEFRDLEFVGGGVIMDEETSRCRILHSRLRYGIIRMPGSENEIRDCEIAYSRNRTLLALSGRRNRIINNYFHHLSEEGGEIAVQIRGEEQLFAYNTMERAGDRFIGIDAVACQVVHNSFRDCSLLARDAGSIHTGGDGGGTEIAYNLSLTDYRRLHYISGIYLDNLASHYIVHHNVVPVIALNAPKNNCLVYNNTIYRFSDYSPHGDEELPPEATKNSLPLGLLQDYAGTQWVNNLFAFEAKPFPGLAFAGNLSEIEPARVFNDRTGRRLDVLEEPWTYDFTLKPGSPAIGAGIPLEGITSGYPGKPADIGAYEFGKPPWKAGWDPLSPRDATYVRPRFPYMNLLENQGFEIGQSLAPWVATGTGSARFYAAKMGWGLSDGEEARFKGAARLGEGANGLEQTVSGVSPGERYIFWMWVKPSSPRQSVQIGIRDGVGHEETATISQMTGWRRMFVHATLPAGATTATVFVRKLSTDADELTVDQASFSREWLMTAKPDAPANTVRFPAIEDTYVFAMQPGRAFGYNGTAALKDSPGNNRDVRHPLMKFDLGAMTGKPIRKATLRFYTSLSSQARMPTIEIREVLDDAWTSRGSKAVTWDTQPPIGGIVARIPPGKAGWIACDLTPFIKARLGTSGIVSLSFSDPDKTGTYVTVVTSQLMMCPPVPTFPPVIELEGP